MISGTIFLHGTQEGVIMTKNEICALTVAVKAFKIARESIVSALDYDGLRQMARIGLSDVVPYFVGSKSLADENDQAIICIVKQYKSMWEKRGRDFTSTFLFEWFITLMAAHQQVKEVPALFNTYFDMIMSEWGSCMSRLAKEFEGVDGETEDVLSIQSEITLPSRAPFLGMGFLCGSRIFSDK